MLFHLLPVIVGDYLSQSRSLSRMIEALRPNKKRRSQSLQPTLRLKSWCRLYNIHFRLSLTSSPISSVFILYIKVLPKCRDPYLAQLTRNPASSFKMPTIPSHGGPRGMLPTYTGGNVIPYHNKTHGNRCAPGNTLLQGRRRHR